MSFEPKLLALIPPQIAVQQTNRDLTKTNYATTSGIDDQTEAALQNSTALGQAFDDRRPTIFCCRPEAFTNPEFQRGLKLLLSPDGKALRVCPGIDRSGGRDIGAATRHELRLGRTRLGDPDAHLRIQEATCRLERMDLHVLGEAASPRAGVDVLVRDAAGRDLDVREVASLTAAVMPAGVMSAVPTIF